MNLTMTGSTLIYKMDNCLLAIKLESGYFKFSDGIPQSETIRFTVECKNILDDVEVAVNGSAVEPADGVYEISHEALGRDGYARIHAQAGRFSDDARVIRIDDGDDALSIKVISSNGDKFRYLARFTSTLTARLFKGSVDITDVAGSRFRWKRKSQQDDTIWNNAHYALSSNILQITQDDVYGSTDFTVEYIDDEDIS